MFAALAVVMATLAVPPAWAATGDITTTVGTGTAGYSGDGGPATAAELNFPFGLVMDDAGNLFVADAVNNVVRKIDPSGTITTVAGTGTAGFSGEGGPATEAQLDLPVGLAVDGSGNLFIADYENHIIRKVDPSGIITTVAGQPGSAGPAGDGGPATSAFLNHPVDMIADEAGNLYIADTGNGEIRKVDTSGIIITLVGDTGETKLEDPAGLALDAAGDLLIVESLFNRVLKLELDADTTTDSGTITTVAGTGTAGYFGDGGPATEAQLDYPFGLTIDPSGNLFITDGVNNAVRNVDTSGTITTVAGTGADGYSGDGGPATAAALSFPSDVAIDPSGNLFITDTGNSVVRRVEAIAAGVPTAVGTTAGSPQGAEVGTAFATALQATVTDVNGGPVEGVEVTFTAPSSGASGTFEGGAATAVATTDASGVTTAPAFSANATAGAFTVEASVAGVADTADFELTNTAPVPTSVAAIAGTPQSAEVGTAFAIALQATVTATNGSPVEGVEVTFTAPASGASGTFTGGTATAVATTNASGVATAPAFSANDTAGAFTVEASVASVAGVAGTASFDLTNTAAASRSDLAFACPPDEATGSGFVDIDGNIHGRAIDCVAANGIASGGPEGLDHDRYGPALDVRRDQMASFIVRMIDDLDPSALPAAPAGNVFGCDVDPGNVHFDSIQRLAAAEVVLGGPGGLADDCYGPERPVQRDQMAAFLNRAIGVADQPLSSPTNFFDDDDASVHEDNINAIAAEGIVVGTGARSYEPSASVRRDQMASFIARTLDYLIERGSAT